MTQNSQAPPRPDVHDVSDNVNNSLNRLALPGGSFSSTYPVRQHGLMLPATVSSSTSSPRRTSTTFRDGNSKKTIMGQLDMTILSVYDLPTREPPMHVSVQLVWEEDDHRDGSVDDDDHHHGANRGPSSSSSSWRDDHALSSICCLYGETGPPCQRHKGRNSFRFGVTNSPRRSQPQSNNNNVNHSNNNNILTLQAPLPALYYARARVRVVPNNSTRGGSSSCSIYQAEYPIRRLLVDETAWLILDLMPEGGILSSATTTNTTATDTSCMVSSPPGILQESNSNWSGRNSNNNNNHYHQTEEEQEPPPTLRLHMTLHSPLRGEIAALYRIIQAWFDIVDRATMTLQELVGWWSTPFFLINPGTRTTTSSTTTTTGPSSFWSGATTTARTNPSSSNSGRANDNPEPNSTTYEKHRRLLMMMIVFLAVPCLAMMAVSMPLWMGVMLVTFPLLLPVVVVGAVVMGCILGVACIVIASTRPMRQWLHMSTTAPVVHTLASTALGQYLLYPIGPFWNMASSSSSNDRSAQQQRSMVSTTVSGLRSIVPHAHDRPMTKFIISLLIDAAGSATYLIPIAAEGADLLWAPIQTALVMAMYPETTTRTTSANTERGASSNDNSVNGVVPPWLKYVCFMEEFFPGTDLVPTATVAWMMEFGPELLSGNKMTTTTTSITSPTQTQQ